MVRSGPGDSLHRSNTQFILLRKNKIPRNLKKLLVALNGKIIMPRQTGLLKKVLLNAGYDIQRPRLALIGAVDTDAKVDAVRAGIGSVGGEEIKDLVCWLPGHGGEARGRHGGVNKLESRCGEAVET
ncbi:hypothetical protein HG530_015285 [Fusarium avenaceum]|nr:hypothetical protein HG530_015285 [Fusarium avenaceum]